MKCNDFFFKENVLVFVPVFETEHFFYGGWEMTFESFEAKVLSSWPYTRYKQFCLMTNEVMGIAETILSIRMLL